MLDDFSARHYPDVGGVPIVTRRDRKKPALLRFGIAAGMAATKSRMKGHFCAACCFAAVFLPIVFIALSIPNWFDSTASGLLSGGKKDGAASESGGDVTIGVFTFPLKRLSEGTMAILLFGYGLSQLRNVKDWLGIGPSDTAQRVSAGHIVDGRTVGTAEAAVDAVAHQSSLDASQRQSVANAGSNVNVTVLANSGEAAEGHSESTSEALACIDQGMRVAQTTILREHIKRLLCLGDAVVTGIDGEEHVRKFRKRHSQNLHAIYNAVLELCELNWFEDAAVHCGGAVEQKRKLLCDAKPRLLRWLNHYAQLEREDFGANRKGANDADANQDEAVWERKFKQLFAGAAEDIRILLAGLENLNRECIRAGNIVERLRELET